MLYCRAEGRKYSKALEWNINIVNSLFISDIMLHGELSRAKPLLAI